MRRNRLATTVRGYSGLSAAAVGSKFIPSDLSSVKTCLLNKSPGQSGSVVAFGVLATNNRVVIRREQEREKASRWD